MTKHKQIRNQFAVTAENKFSDIYKNILRDKTGDKLWDDLHMNIWFRINIRIILPLQIKMGKNEET